MKILAIAASNNKNSINKKLLNYTASLLKDTNPEHQIEVLDLIDYELPLYRQDREQNDGIPKAAIDFYKKIGQSDYVIISFAEHNGSFTAVYKNLFDWMSRIDQKVYQDKPVILMAASPGPRGGAGVLSAAEMGAPFFGMNVKAKISVPRFQDNFDFDTQQMTHQEIKQHILDAITPLQQ
ncbi:MAG: NAD(P)H-dependent oxidoreductase [Pseudomonadota bacterium]